MGTEPQTPDVSPGRTGVMPDTYAMYVDDQHVHVFQYRINISTQDGEWYFVETLDRGDEPRLSLEYATPMAPTQDGYWIYAKAYDCELDCN